MHNRTSAYTLIELLITLAILGILATLIFGGGLRGGGRYGCSAPLNATSCPCLLVG
jgi:prepilin-type N-terminal cleavage/methylation domain-containing protein